MEELVKLIEDNPLIEVVFMDEETGHWYLHDHPVIKTTKLTREEVLSLFASGNFKETEKSIMDRDLPRNKPELNPRPEVSYSVVADIVKAAAEKEEKQSSEIEDYKDQLSKKEVELVEKDSEIARLKEQLEAASKPISTEVKDVVVDPLAPSTVNVEQEIQEKVTEPKKAPKTSGK
jgi:methyl coenzyme M reductase subunit C-like uncharacterized protein (methanogenesis marker protein 7)